jgi:hypothetical protein
MKISVLLLALALTVVLVASVCMPDGGSHTAAVWGWVALGVLGLTASNVWICLRMWATTGHLKMLVASTVATFILFLFAFMQWASWYK